MLHFVEVNKIDEKFAWLELKVADAYNGGIETVRLVIDDARDMVGDFLKRYQAKREIQINVPDAQQKVLREFFEEALMAKVMREKNSTRQDFIDLLPTTVLNFRYPERTTFRKSRAARVNTYLEEAFSSLQQRHFDEALQRLAWVHDLSPNNRTAFELQVVCLRNQKKYPECVQILEKWAASEPNEEDPLVGLTEMWLYLGQAQKAREAAEKILETAPGNIMAMVGIIQAKLKLGEDVQADLRKAWVLNNHYMKEMLENRFDFRFKQPRGEARSRTLEDIAKTYNIPLKRILERARRGVLPMHAPGEDGLFRFVDEELDRYVGILHMLGLELEREKHTPKQESETDPVVMQPGLFDNT